jgi:hypothetical protein
MKSLARMLRSIAEWLDPQPSTIELLEVDDPTWGHVQKDRPNDYGFPVYFHRRSKNGFEVWPMPAANMRLLYRWRS